MEYCYKCSNCECVFLVDQPMDESHLTYPCYRCGGDGQRVFNVVNVHYKSSGFYVTDNRKVGNESK